MNNMHGNPHAELAEEDIEYPGAWDELEAVTALLQTNARATLALAYEQRTANLIALLAVAGTDMTDWPKQIVDAWTERAEDIGARVGYNE